MTRLGKLVRLSRYPGFLRVIARYGVAAAVEHLALLRTLQANTIIDIGANRGQFALVARHCLPDARIISFEPLARSAAVFRRVFTGDLRTALHEVAIAPKGGAALMNGSHRDDSSSLLPIGERQRKIFRGTEEAGVSQVTIGPLRMFVGETVFQPPALLKVDVQGYELQALQACGELLCRFDYLYVECSFVELYTGQALADEVIDFVRQHGFTFAGNYNMHYDAQGRAIQGDFLFQKPRAEKRSAKCKAMGNAD